MGLAQARPNYYTTVKKFSINYNRKQLTVYITSIKNSCLKLKNEVGMAVLKSKQTRVVYRDNQHIRIVHPYACFFRLVRLCDTIYFYLPIQLRLYSVSNASVGMYYTYVLIISIIILLLFVCFLALPSLLHFSILSNFFYTCHCSFFYDLRSFLLIFY